MKLLFRGIWFKLMAGFFGLSFVPLTLLGFILFQSGKRDIVRSSMAGVRDVAGVSELNIENFVASTSDTTLMLSRIPDVAALTRALSGGSRKPSDRAALRDILKAAAPEGGHVAAHLVLHPASGEVLASSDPMQEGKFFDKRPYFATGKEALNVYRAHFWPGAQNNIIAISAPVRHRGGLVGVMVSWVRLESLLKAAAVRTDASVYMVNRSNLYVMHEAPGEGIPLITGVYTEATQRALSGGEGSIIYTNDAGEEVVAAYRLIRSLDLALIAERPLSALLLNINALGMRIMYVTFAVAAIVMLMSLIFVRRIAGPLTEMSEAAHEIASGNLSHRIAHRSGGELGVLSASMNHMAGSLATRERELRELIVTLNTLVENIPEGVALLDESGRLIIANPVAIELLDELGGKGVGSMLGDLAGRPVASFVTSHPNHAQSAPKWHQVNVARPDGNLFLEVTARKIPSGGGLVLLIKDQTEVHLMRERAQAQEKIAAVGQMASGIAHDFGNVLTTVIGFAEMIITDELLPPELRPYMDAILKSGQRASELIDQILDFTRNIEGRFKAVDLGEMVIEFVRFIRHTIPEDIAISTNAVKGGLYVRADAGKLHQVLTNLAVNARDAMPGGGRLTITLGHMELAEEDRPPLPEMTAGRWVSLTVHDTGQGIAPAVLPHIFEPFYTTKGPRKGTGLGLAQVFGIVRQHSGHMEVASGHAGTSFTLYLSEVGQQPDGGATHMQNEFESPLSGMAEGAGERVLVVEDDQVVLNLVTKLLARLNYDVITAPDGHEGIRIFEAYSGRFSLVVTDLVMPGMNGLELAAGIRKLSPAARVIVISGYPAESHGMKGPHDLQRAGIAAWVKKPFRPNELAAAIRDAIASNKA